MNRPVKAQLLKQTSTIRWCNDLSWWKSARAWTATVTIAVIRPAMREDVKEER